MSSGSSSFGERVPSGAAPRGRRWLRRLGILMVVVVAVVLGAFAALAFVAKKELDEFVTPTTAAMKQAQSVLSKPLPGEPTNVLLLGSDRRGNLDPSDKRSDTMLLVRLDPEKKSISMLSFPRDLWVEVPGHGQAKINDAYHFGGPALSVKTVNQLTGLDVNFVMNVDFNGFRGVVNQLGGVWVDVDRRYHNPPGTGFATIDIEPGYQLLAGQDALDFARFRHDAGADFNRIARQQQVLASLKKQVSASKVASNVPGLFSVLKKNTEVVGGGGDGVPARVLLDYLRLALELDAKDIYQVDPEWETGEAANGASIVVYDEETMKSAVEAFLSPSAEAREETADQLTGEQSPQAGASQGAEQAPDPSTVTVTVKNGSGVDGAARRMTEQLRDAGYEVTLPDGDAAMADNQNYAATRVQYHSDRARAAAEALAARMAGASAEPSTSANGFDTQLLVIVGRTGTELQGSDGGQGEAPVYAGNRVPEKGAAKVARDPEYGRDEFATVGRMGMPLLYPTVRELTSTYEEVRAYKIAKGRTTYDAYRLVAQTAEGQYWGLQGTSWPDPPILEGATREVTRGTRRYRLYFNGTKLHMVAWRQGGGTYWVSNSVLDALSNETMLAIADGVRPYR